MTSLTLEERIDAALDDATAAIGKATAHQLPHDTCYTLALEACTAYAVKLAALNQQSARVLLSPFPIPRVPAS